MNEQPRAVSPPVEGGAAPVPPIEHPGRAAAASAFGDDLINILIVDDEPKNLTVLETILDDPSYRLVRAQSADEALLALVVEEFALLILDVRMPSMTGFELAQMIKERRKTALVPIIFLTAYYNEDQHVLEGYGAGAVDYLNKPVNAAVLRSKVAVFAELYRKSRECSVANRSLLAEVGERRRAEEQLRELNETLEQRVAERTEALHASEASERARRAEVEALMDALPVAVVITQHPSGRPMSRNRAATELLRLSNRGIDEERPNYVVTSRGRLLATDEIPLRRAAATGQAVLGEELGIIFSDREERHVLASAVPLFDDAGVVRGCVGAFVDITAQKRAEEALKEADRHKDEFLATLAHELRNPLAPVRNAAQILQMRGPVTPDLQWACDVIDRQMQAMTQLIDDLMDVSRISRNEIHLRRERVELAHVVQGAIETTRSLVEERGHTLAVTLPPEPVVLDADLTRLAQVLLNLLSNAAKYTEKGGRIDLRAEQRDGEVVVSLRDTGIGIPTDKLSTIFEMFSQVESALSRSQGGLGIGLCLVKRLVEMHGGSIVAKSEGPGRGSEFVMRLPVVHDPEYTPTASSDHAEEMLTSRLRILVVDDNRDSAASLAMLLESMGNDVRTAHDGEEALRAASEFLPHVGLLDIGLPKMNGYDAAQAIRQEPWGKNMVLVAVTGWGQEDDKRLAIEAGFDRHMVKPLDPHKLMKFVADLPAADT